MEKEENAKINEKKKEDASKAQIISDTFNKYELIILF